MSLCRHFHPQYVSSMDLYNQPGTQTGPGPSSPSAPSSYDSNPTFKSLQTALITSGFAIVLIFTTVLLTYVGYRARRERKKLERISASKPTLNNRIIDFDVELKILGSGHGPASPGRAVLVSESVGSHRGGNRSGGQNAVSLRTREGASGRSNRSRAEIATGMFLERRSGPPAFSLAGIRGSQSLCKTPQMSRINVDLRDLREQIHKEEIRNQAKLPKYELGAPPPAYQR